MYSTIVYNENDNKYEIINNTNINSYVDLDQHNIFIICVVYVDYINKIILFKRNKHFP